MRYLGPIVVIPLGMLMSGTVFAQTPGGTSSSTGSPSPMSSTPNATPGTVTPGLGGTALPLPSTTPTQRATTGVIENQQLLDRPQDQPSTIQSDRASPGPTDVPAGGTITNAQQGSGGAATGNTSRVRNKSDTTSRQTAVIGPGQLSYPAALERPLPKTP